jgi:hypothetical protein
MGLEWIEDAEVLPEEIPEYLQCAVFLPHFYRVKVAPLTPKIPVPVCGIAVLAAVAAEIADSANEKYKSVGLNALALRIPYERTAVFHLDPDAHKYYVVLNKQGVFEGKTRFFLASPCDKVDLKVEKGKMTCELTECRLSDEDMEFCEYEGNWTALGVDNETACIEKIKNINCGTFVKGPETYRTANKVYVIDGQQFEISQISNETWEEGTEIPPVDNEGNPILGVKECRQKHLWKFWKEGDEIDTIEIYEISDIKDFCYSSRSGRELVTEAFADVAFIALDIGIGILTVSTYGVAAPLYFVSGAGYVAVDKYLTDQWPER